MSVRIELISAEDTRPIRHAILRPGMSIESLIYPGDDDLATFHMGTRDGEGALIGIISFYDEPVPGTAAPAWRIRGMATLPEHRGLVLTPEARDCSRIGPGLHSVAESVGEVGHVAGVTSEDHLRAEDLFGQLVRVERL